MWEASHSPEAASGASQQAPGTLQHVPMDTSTDLQEFFAEPSKNQEKKWKEKCKERGFLTATSTLSKLWKCLGTEGMGRS